MTIKDYLNRILGVSSKIKDYNEADSEQNKGENKTNVFDPDKIRDHVFWGTNPYKLDDDKKNLFDKASAQVAKEDFHTALISAKGGILLFLALVIFVYQLYFVKLDPNNKTFFNDSRTAWKPLVESGIAAFIGLISVFIVNLIRLGLKNALTWECWQVYITVFIVIFLFDISEEASGFNRYMANISKTDEEYKELNEHIESSIPDELIEKEKPKGDPFITSIAYVTIGIGTFAVMYFIFNMIRSTIRGKISGMNSVTRTAGGWGIFSVELFIVVALNFAGPILSKVATGGTVSSSTYFSSSLFAVIALSLQIMCQYTGVMPAFEKSTKKIQ